MGNVKCPENVLEEIKTSELLVKVMEKKKQGLRLSQACAAVTGGHTELSYSFADDETFALVTLRIVLEDKEEVPSITEIIPYAFFYENEMKELFGVNINMINLDYNNKLYRIEAETPFLSTGKEGK
jgi:ech hydrogenase subunit D